MDMRSDRRVRFDTKIAVLLRDDLAVWQRLNVTAFLVSGIGTGASRADRRAVSGRRRHAYLPEFRQPVMVFEGGKETADGGARQGAGPRARTSRCSPRTCSPPATTRTTARRCAPCRGADLDLVGIAVYGPRNAVDKALKGAAKHP